MKLKFLLFENFCVDRLWRTSVRMGEDHLELKNGGCSRHFFWSNGQVHFLSVSADRRPKVGRTGWIGLLDQEGSPWPRRALSFWPCQKAESVSLCKEKQKLSLSECLWRRFCSLWVSEERARIAISARLRPLRWAVGWKTTTTAKPFLSSFRHWARFNGFYYVPWFNGSMVFI